MINNLNDQEFFDLFQEQLPPAPLPPDVSERVDQLVMAEVAALRASRAAQQATLPSSAEPHRPTPESAPRALLSEFILQPSYTRTRAMPPTRPRARLTRRSTPPRHTTTPRVATIPRLLR